jgi:purine-binding chemotaxis protein CheW
MESIDYTDPTCIIVTEIANRGKKKSQGIVVDSVSEVLNIKSGEIENTPDFGARLDTAYILGMAKIGEGIKILLDIDKVMGGEEIDNLQVKIA